MMNLIDIANKITAILNGTDPTIDSGTLLKRPNYLFLAKAVGFHLDSIANPKTDTNYIPVFIDTLGGSISPVPELLETSYTIPITLYFPMHAKDDFLDLGDYLSEIFVGKVINFGGHSGYGLCNISPIQLGEITDLDLKEFAKWTECNYSRPISSNEPFMSLSFNLYISSAKDLNKQDGPLYGNNTSIQLSFTKDRQFYEDTTPIFQETSVGENTGESSEQILGEKFIKGLPSTTAYTVPLNLVVKYNDFYKTLLKAYFDRTICDITLNINIVITNGTSDQIFARFVVIGYISSADVKISKGEFITLALNIADRKDL